MKIKTITTEFLISDKEVLVLDTLIPIDKFLSAAGNMNIKGNVLTSTVEILQEIGVPNDLLTKFKTTKVNITTRLNSINLLCRLSLFGWKGLTHITEEYFIMWLNEANETDVKVANMLVGLDKLKT